MSQWGNKRQAVSVNATSTVETSDGAPIGTYTLVKGGGGDTANFGNTSGSRANTDLNMYKAQAPFPTMPGMKVSVIPVSSAEMSNPNSGPVPVLTQTASITVIDNGQGYVAPVTADAVFANGTVRTGFFTATVANGNLNTFNQTVPSTLGTIFTSTPTVNNVTLTKRMNITPANNVGFNNVTEMILVANADQWLNVNDTVTYSVPAGNVAIVPLTAGSNYYIAFVNSTGFALKSGVGTANINITDARTTSTEQHTFYGAAATLGAVVVTNTISTGVGAVDANASPVAHAGWVVRREGTGGRAGRVHYETLVAMHSLPSN
jgi:hypothetical protein